MDLRSKANLIIYRIRQKGLEVFLVNSELEDGNLQWQIPQGKIDINEAPQLQDGDNFIALDPITQTSGETEEAFAVEGDWHDIPSLKSLLSEDAEFVKERIKAFIPDLEKHGAYFAVKEAVKKVLPSQFEFLKELKEIITEKNSLKDL